MSDATSDADSPRSGPFEIASGPASPAALPVDARSHRPAAGAASDAVSDVDPRRRDTPATDS